jgi:hypothetical protein
MKELKDIVSLNIRHSVFIEKNQLHSEAQDNRGVEKGDEI